MSSLQESFLQSYGGMTGLLSIKVALEEFASKFCLNGAVSNVQKHMRNCPF